MRNHKSWKTIKLLGLTTKERLDSRISTHKIWFGCGYPLGTRVWPPHMWIVALTHASTPPAQTNMWGMRAAAPVWHSVCTRTCIRLTVCVTLAYIRIAQVAHHNMRAHTHSQPSACIAQCPGACPNTCAHAWRRFAHPFHMTRVPMSLQHMTRTPISSYPREQQISKSFGLLFSLFFFIF